MTGRLEELEQQIQELQEQVRKFIGQEQELMQGRNDLSSQLCLHEKLYTVSRELSQSRDPKEAVEIAVGFAIFELEYQRVCILGPDASGKYRVRHCDGYYDEEIEEALQKLEFDPEYPGLCRAVVTAERVVLADEDEDEDLRALGALFHVSELILWPLNVTSLKQASPEIFLVGNSAERARFHSRVRPDAKALTGIGTLVAHLSTTLDNAENYRQLEDERRLLEIKVEQRTQELSEAMEELRRLDNLKTQFFANVSHELRTPLTLSIGPLDMILGSGELSEQTARDLKVVQNNQLRLLRLINDLLDFSKLEAGRTIATFRRELVVEVVRFLAEALRPAAAARGIKLTVDATDEDLELYLDRGKFEKIIMNLLSNAFKFTPDNGTIAVGVEAGDTSVRIHVSDTGIGIPESQISRIFERFSQVDGSATRKYAGTGIGLALVKEFTELHGGSVKIESEENVGTIFTLVFQRGSTHIDPGLLADELDGELDGLEEVKFELLAEFDQGEEETPQPEVAAKAPELPLSGGEQSDAQGEQDFSALARSCVESVRDRLLVDATVLVVDDNAAMRRMMTTLLRGHFTTLAADDGAKGLALARETFPDLIISDVMMPNMSGTELCAAVKSDTDCLGRTPVILVTARADLSMKLEGFQHGADDYLVKPFQGAELLARVSNLVKVRRQERELFLAMRDLEQRNAAIRRDLAEARTFQRSLLPQLPNYGAVQFGALYCPADEVGGDIYDVCRRGDDSYRVFLADATGHGIQASLRTMVIKSHYDRLKLQCDTPRAVLERINDELMGLYEELELRFSACCFDLEVRNGQPIRVSYANAGHPFLVHIAGEAVEKVRELGTFLGISARVEVGTRQFDIGRNDRLVVYTDGMFEQWNEAGEMFGEERLLAALGSSREDQDPDDTLMDTLVRLSEFTGDSPLTDDLTCICLRIR